MNTLRKCAFYAFAALLCLWIPCSAATRRATKAPVRKPHVHHAKTAKELRTLDDGSFVGIASWYGKQHQGRHMANDEKFNRWRFTAANKFLPLGTRCIVTFPKTGKSVVVTITDRGPFKRGRIMDLSEAAATQLGLRAYGVGEVIIQRLVAEPYIPEEQSILSVPL
jgi:rare lipoprotein A